MNKELTYWLALAHVPKIRTRKKNEIIVQLFKQGKTVVDFFESEYSVWEDKYQLNKSEVELFLDAKKELSNYAFMIEDLLEQGYNILPYYFTGLFSNFKKESKKNICPTCDLY